MHVPSISATGCQNWRATAAFVPITRVTCCTQNFTTCRCAVWGFRRPAAQPTQRPALSQSATMPAEQSDVLLAQAALLWVSEGPC